MQKNLLTTRKNRSLLLSAATSASYAGNMSRIVNISEAKAKLSELAQEVEAGQEITVSRKGLPVMKLVPLTSEEKEQTPPRRKKLELGKFAEEFKDFDWDEWDRLDEEMHKIWRKFGYMD